MATKIYEASFCHGIFSVKVHRLPETREYRSRYYVNGKPLAEYDYFTDSKEDAIETANAMLAGMRKQLGNLVAPDC